MNAKQRRTLAAIFSRPTRSDIAWSDLESLFRALGATVAQGRGSRLRVDLQGAIAVFHRPYPRKEANESTVEEFREFLENAGVVP